MSLISSRTPERNPFSAPVAVEIRGWLVRSDGRFWFRWWCPIEKYWHTNGWAGDAAEDGLRRAPRCLGPGEIRLVPIGAAPPDVLECIEDDREPPGERAAGPYITPALACARLQREFAFIIEAAGQGEDEFLDKTVRLIEREVMIIKEWQTVHRRMHGGCRRAHVMAAVDARYRQRRTNGGRL